MLWHEVVDIDEMWLYSLIVILVIVLFRFMSPWLWISGRDRFVSEIPGFDNQELWVGVYQEMDVVGDD